MKVKQGTIHSLLFFTFLFTLASVSFTSLVIAAPIPLSLDQAIQRMIENNLTIKTNALNYEQAQISFDIAWNTFYMPSFTLSVDSTSTYGLGSAPFSVARTDPAAYRTRGYPANTVKLALGSYTLFNFFKDKATYDIAKLSYERARAAYQESLRTSKNVLINLYFQTKIAQEKLEASERSMTISQAIAELIESRKSLGKATEDEQNSASVDLLSARVAYGAEKKTVDEKAISLNTNLNATPETEFKLTTEPPFVPVHLDEKHLFNVFKTQSSIAQNAENDLISAEINAAGEEKKRLPLPTISFSGLTISYANGYAGGTTPTYTAGTNGAIEVAAAISLSLPIFGPNGFFNDKAVRNSFINSELKMIAQKNAMMNGELFIRQKIVALKQLETQIKTQRESFGKNSKILDNIFKKAASGAMDRLQLRDALKEARESELSYLDSLLGHIAAKTELSEYVGLDRLPGDQL